ncbi:hypothetical protein BDQ12DRAFT_686771 [Crucibulum laeve]|uniref:Uncharacterized protein n=1 Tax=Crucibulum laeve TaxID=68775 RepID=A0A5C3LUW3_9AGAR|nr:hypothetical protein BDQ12DRAFT_686771 [Crucibulum laeve]
MSLESLEKLPMVPRTLSVDIPGISSADSSLAPSPTGILESATSASSSSLSSHTLSVKFAPLPKLAPRKRRSTTPLGIAARGQMVRRRRGMYEAEPVPVQQNPMWTEEELEQQRLKQDKMNEKKEGDVEDPFVALGRMMKGAGKTLWRRMSQKELSKTRAMEEEKEKNSDESGERHSSLEDSEGPKQEKPLSTAKDPSRTVLAPLFSNGEETEHKVEEEGRVWEEEIDDRFPLNIGQTETIIEGRGLYTSPTTPTGTTVTAKVEVLKTPPPPPPAAKTGSV